MVDPARLVALLDRLLDEVRELRGLAELAELSRRDLAAVKYGFIVAIEVCIDVGQHIISTENLNVPDSYGEVFEVLFAAGFLERELFERLRGMAGFRNLLVHGYAVLNDAIVRENLRTRLGDFDEFRAAIAPLAGV